MKVTLTRDLAPHKKGTTLQVSDATGARLVRKGAAKEAGKQGSKDAGDKGDGEKGSAN